MERPVSAMADPPAIGNLTGPDRRWLSRSGSNVALDDARQLALAYLGDLQDAPVSKHTSLEEMGQGWASLQLGFDAARDGLGDYPAIPVMSSTEAHQSAVKALSILGLGRHPFSDSLPRP